MRQKGTKSTIKFPTTIKPEYVGVDQAEVMTDISRWTWRRYAYRGKIASTKVGSRLLIPISEVQRVMGEGLRPALGK